MKAAPSNRQYELEYRKRGYQCIAGVDEVGVGCLAGPVVAAAVVLNWDDIPDGITDSKKLSAKVREVLASEIRQRAVAHAIGIASVEEVDTINIFHAAKLAMVRAVNLLRLTTQILLIDGKFGIPHPTEQRCLIKGDLLSVSIGAASILAKVHRDHQMEQMDEVYPGYGFAKHKGYGSVEHRRQLQRQGPSPIHRKSFSWTPV
jgi:ribonuclease HII